MEQTEAKEPSVFPVGTPITINYRVIKSSCLKTLNRAARGRERGSRRLSAIGTARLTELSALSLTLASPPLQSPTFHPMGTSNQVGRNRTLRSTWLKSENPSPRRGLERREAMEFPVQSRRKFSARNRAA